MASFMLIATESVISCAAAEAGPRSTNISAAPIRSRCRMTASGWTGYDCHLTRRPATIEVWPAAPSRGPILSTRVWPFKVFVGT